MFGLDFNKPSRVSTSSLISARNISKTPTIDFIEDIAFNSFWEIECQLNLFAKKEGYKYSVGKAGIPRGKKLHFQLSCYQSFSNQNLQACKHVLSFKNVGDDLDDPAKGPFELVTDKIIKHNHPPIQRFLNSRVPIPEERKMEHDNRRVACIGQMFGQGNTKYAETDNSDEEEEDSDNEVGEEEEEVGGTVEKEEGEREDPDNEIGEGLEEEEHPDPLDVFHDSSLSSYVDSEPESFVKEPKRRIMRSNADIVTSNNGQGRVHELMEEVEQLRRKYDQAEKENQHGRRESDIIEGEREEVKGQIAEMKIENDDLKTQLAELKNENGQLRDQIRSMEDRGDSYKVKYEDLRRITKERMRFMEEDEKRRAEAAEIERMQNEKKRKLDESFFGFLED
ncbi:uncharacterized protein L199_006436 [Kwoniella botswanensis]|uniref:uncharacterized protein n=1 Tax=Kwoniella botswanensis TaxID=1268659 RepID=UPI00315D5310